MTRQAEFSQLANDLSNRYRNFLETIVGSYNRTILGSEFTGRAATQFTKEVNNILKTFLENEVKVTVATYEKLNAMVTEDTKNLGVSVVEDSEWAEYLSTNTNFLYEAIKLQAAKDTLFASNYMRSKMLELMSLSAGEAKYTLVSSHKDINFYYTDKLGRKINSVKYIRTLVRDYLVKNYNDMIYGSAQLNAIEELVVYHVDSNHNDHGKIVSVNEVNELNYFTVRLDIFHPNSDAILRIDNVQTK